MFVLVIAANVSMLMLYEYSDFFSTCSLGRIIKMTFPLLYAKALLTHRTPHKCVCACSVFFFRRVDKCVSLNVTSIRNS